MAYERRIILVIVSEQFGVLSLQKQVIKGKFSQQTIGRKGQKRAEKGKNGQKRAKIKVPGYPVCGLAKPPGGSLPKCAGIGAGTAGAWGYILA